MKVITEDQIKGMLTELLKEVMRKMPGGCVDAKLTAFTIGQSSYFIEVKLPTFSSALCEQN